MKKLLIEYVNIVGYIITGLVFALAYFILFINLYHNKEVSNEFVKSDSYVDVYTKNKEKIAEMKNSIASFDPNNYRGNIDQLDLISINSKLNICVSKYEETEANKIFVKEKVNVRDVYQLLNLYQSDIINDCITLQIYSMNVSSNSDRLQSFNQIKPYVEMNSKFLMNDLNYVKRVLQNNSSYQFSSDYDKINIFNMTRDSYTMIEASYQNSIDLVYSVSQWFNQILRGYGA